MSNVVNPLTTARLVLADSYHLQRRVSQQLQAAWQAAILLNRPGTELGEAMLMQVSPHEYLAVVPQPTADQQREIARWLRRDTFGQPLIQWQTSATAMLVQQCQQAGIQMLEVPADWEPCFTTYPQVAVRIVPQRVAERSYRLTGGKLLYSLRRGEDVPPDVLYCGRGKGSVVPAQPSKYGCFGNPVKVSRRPTDAEAGEKQPCPECDELHFSGKETLGCYRLYLRRRLNGDAGFRAAFLAAMQRYPKLGCYCRSGECHTSVMAEVWRNYRRRMAAS